MRVSKTLNILLLGVALWCSGKYLIVEYWDSQADDFSSLYVAARVIDEGKVTSLYDHHPSLFHVVPPGEFTHTAEQAGFKGFLHPYVHLPLFSFLLRPLLWIPYSVATKVVLLVNVCAIMLSLYLILRLAHREGDMRWWSIGIIALSFFFPLRYALWLGQTSPLVFLGIVAIYSLVSAGHPRISGALLGGLLCFKLTPLFLLCYFMLKRQQVVVIASLATVTVVVIFSILSVGWDAHVAFLHTVTRLKGLSLASWNNQSLDGFLLRWITDPSQLYNWRLMELGFTMTVVKCGTVLLILLLWLLIFFFPFPVSGDDRDCLAFSFAIVLMVVLPPIAWSHYLLFLMFPYGVVMRDLEGWKFMPCCWLVRGGLLVSWVAVALPPSYLGIVDTPSFLLPLAQFPLTHKVPLPVAGSGGFLGVVVLMVVIAFVHLCREHIPSQ